MIRRGDADEVDVFVGQDLAEVADRLGGAFGLIHRLLQVRLVDVADRLDGDVFHPAREAEIPHDHPAHADESGGEAVVRALEVPGED